MRRKFLFGLGLSGVLAGFGVTVAQVPAPVSPALPTSPALPPGVLPAGTPSGVSPSGTPTGVLPPGVRPASGAAPVSAYVPPVGGLSPALPPGVPPIDGTRPAPTAPIDTEIHSALGANHPWVVKPEHGAYFICVKSYSRPNRPTIEDSGPSARVLAEELATEIRELYRVQAFLYEYVSEERKAEMASIAAARERARLFASQQDKYRQEAQLKGMIFLEDDNPRVRFKTVNYRDQIAVLVGGFQSDKDARNALDKVRKWLPPKNKNLMDGAAIVRADRSGKQMLEQGHMNPYLTASVVSNPCISRPASPEDSQLDPFILELNKGRPNSLLSATKGWTLALKSFTAPVEIVSKDSTPGGGIFGSSRLGNGGADALLAGAEQAEALAEALRKMKAPAERGGQSLGLEGFVFHTRTGSIVTVGQFDGPNDPALIQTRQLLSSIKMNVSEDKTGLRPVMNAPSLFGNMMPIPVPKLNN